MRYLERGFINLKIASRSLISAKLSSLLSMLGVMLGTFSLVVVSNLSSSLHEKTEREIASLGKNLLIVQSGRVHRFGSRIGLFATANNLTLDDGKAIREAIDFVEAVSPCASEPFAVRFGSRVLKSVLITGVIPNYSQLRNFHPALGRFILKEDNQESRKVAVLGRKVALKLFGATDPIGNYILIRRVPLLVVGVMEEKGSDVSGVDQDNQIFIPLQTFLRRFVNRTYVSTMYVQVTNELAIPGVKAEIEYLLRYRHHIAKGEKDDFTVIALEDVMSLKKDAARLITVLGRIAASVSFVIGGLGILSMMILMVTERRLEIGIRRAVGSRKRDITIQFLVESSFISLTGGMVGMVLGYIVCFIIFWESGFPYTFSLLAGVLAFLASVAVGIMAGVYPSRRAISVNPVDVLRG